MSWKSKGGLASGAHYQADYFGAFVIGPDGHNVEVVCHRAEPEAPPS